MSKGLFLATLVSLAIICPVFSVDIDHPITIDDRAIYNFEPFAKKGNITVNYTETHDENGHEVTTVKESFTFSMMDKPRVKACTGDGKVYANFKEGEKGDCQTLCTLGPKYEFIDSENMKKGITITYPKDAKSPSPKELQVTLLCDKKIDWKAKITFHVKEVTEDTIRIESTTRYGCYITSTKDIEDMVNSHKYIVGAVLLIAGLFLLVFGLTMFKITIFLVAAIFVVGALAFCAYPLITPETKTTALYIGGILIVLLGLGAGYLAVRYQKYGFLSIGVALGLVGGLFLFNAFLKSALQNKEWAFYLFMVVCGIAGGLMMFYLRKNITIIATSCIGSYLGVRGISIFAGHFPSEIAMVRGRAPLTNWTYLYLGIMAVVAIAGIYVQHVLLKKREAELKKIDGYSEAPNEISAA